MIIFGVLNHEMFNRRWLWSCLLRRDLPLVTLIGKAGTGKTLLALAAGLMQTEDLGEYKKLLVARPIVPVGKDIGFCLGKKRKSLGLGCSQFMIIWNTCLMQRNPVNWMRF